MSKKSIAEYLEFIYPRELEIKETTGTAASSSFLDCYLYIDSGKLTTRLFLSHITEGESNSDNVLHSIIFTFLF